MKKSTSKRIRFDFTFSAGDVAYERLHLEMIQIANTHPNDPVEAAAEQKKHLLRILHAYSNSGVSSLAPTTSYRTPEQTKQIAMHRSEPTFPNATPPAATNAENNGTFTTPVPTPSKTNLVNDEKFKTAAVRLEDGSLKLGDLIID